MVFSPIPNVTVAENRFSQRHERFLPRENSFKFVTECFFVTQRALHVGLLPAVETFTTTASELGKQIQAKIGEEKLLKDLNAVSEDSHGLVPGQNPGHSASRLLSPSYLPFLPFSHFLYFIFLCSFSLLLLHLPSCIYWHGRAVFWTPSLCSTALSSTSHRRYGCFSRWRVVRRFVGTCPSVYVTIAMVALYLFTTISLFVLECTLTSIYLSIYLSHRTGNIAQNDILVTVSLAHPYTVPIP